MLPFFLSNSHPQLRHDVAHKGDPGIIGETENGFRVELDGRNRQFAVLDGHNQAGFVPRQDIDTSGYRIFVRHK